MATTRLIPMHKIKNQSIAYTVHELSDQIKASEARMAEIAVIQK
ncbi:MAG: hypothetical protein ACI4D7_03455 [Lachnospiraceae bacterium]